MTSRKCSTRRKHKGLLRPTRKLRTWCFSKCIPPPAAHELLVVNEKSCPPAAGPHQKGRPPRARHLRPERLRKGPFPGARPRATAPTARRTPLPIPAGGHPEERGLTFVSLTFWSLREEGTSPSSKSSEKKTEKERQMNAGPEQGRKEPAWGGRVVRGRRGRALGRRGSPGSPATRQPHEGKRGNEEGKPGPLLGGSAARPARPGEEREERAGRETQGAAGLRPESRAARGARRGPARSGGPGPSRAPSRLTQWPRHAGWACTCSKRLLADMALGSSRGTTAADSSSGQRRRRMSPDDGSRGCGGGFCP